MKGGDNLAYVKKEQPGIMLYWSAFDALEEMVDGDAKQMLQAMRRYAQYNETPDFSGNPSLKMAWCFMKGYIDKDRERYTSTCEKNAQKGRKSAERRRKKAPDENAPKFGLG